jgi:hypothetical protein
MRMSRSRNSRLAATSSGASVCQAVGLELERDVNDGGVRPVCPACGSRSPVASAPGSATCRRG